jgi:hypothetical protein
VIFLHLLGMDDAEVTSDVGVPEICSFELPVFLVCEVGHGALQFCDNRAWGKVARSEDAQLGLASSVGVARGVRNFNGTSWKV